MKSIFIFTLVHFLFFQVSLVGKKFEYIDQANESKEVYHFQDNNRVKLTMSTVFNGKYLEDVCSGTYKIEANKVKVVCNCPDKEVYPDPIRETFNIGNPLTSLSTTIIYDRNRKPRVFKLVN